MIFSKQLLKWYAEHGRCDLPWRTSVTPYRVWLSEIMLQQTQVSTVIHYFKTFINTFPTISALAKASEDEVLHLWSGLGYYSRARNLHKTAKIICDQFKGKFPKELETLQSLPGIGRSTAGAIAAIAFKEAHPILDGNVKRVLMRYFALEGWSDKQENVKLLWQYAAQLTPKKEVDDYTQAIMDLGSMICTRTKPRCELCPVQKRCQAKERNLTHLIPAPKPRKKLPEKHSLVLIIKNKEGHILLEKRPPRGIWGGLWCLPVCELGSDIPHFCKLNFGLPIKKIRELLPFRHTFTHFHLHMYPMLLYTTAQVFSIQDPTRLWYNSKEQRLLGLAAPIKKLLEQ